MNRVNGMSEAQERDELIERSRRFLETAPEVERIAFGVLVHMVADRDWDLTLLDEAAAKGIRKPSEVVDYILNGHAA